MTDLLLIIILIFVVVNLLLVFSKKDNKNFEKDFEEIKNLLAKIQTSVENLTKSQRDEFQINRKELSDSMQQFRERFDKNVEALNVVIRDRFNDFSKQQAEINKIYTDNIKDIRQTVEKQLDEIKEDNSKQLDEMRKTVDEKLQKTLNERLSQSFETVSNQLKAVQQGLGEMKNLANDVGGLKKVLSNVKMRGGIGEIQLSMLLEQILSPAQYEANVKTKQNSADLVEFAIKLPGKDDQDSTVWLPVDAKFPKDVFEAVQDAYDDGDIDKIRLAQKNLENTIKKMAKDISTKYLDPPNTTDFGIMFLPFEGIYAEVVRNSNLLEELQRNYQVIVTGPSTFAAILNSLQMGFRTLAIQQRSSEVWKILGAVKTEFAKFGDLLSKAHKNIQTGLNQLDNVMGTRTRAINRKLKDVESLSQSEANKILPEITDDNEID